MPNSRLRGVKVVMMTKIGASGRSNLSSQCADARRRHPAAETCVVAGLARFALTLRPQLVAAIRSDPGLMPDRRRLPNVWRTWRGVCSGSFSPAGHQLAYGLEGSLSGLAFALVLCPGNQQRNFPAISQKRTRPTLARVQRRGGRGALYSIPALTASPRLAYTSQGSSRLPAAPGDPAGATARSCAAP
jgi:hypothetical protein